MTRSAVPAQKEAAGEGVDRINGRILDRQI